MSFLFPKCNLFDTTALSNCHLKFGLREKSIDEMFAVRSLAPHARVKSHRREISRRDADENKAGRGKARCHLIRRDIHRIHRFHQRTISCIDPTTFPDF